jgi:DNA-binding PadR family transcriptional regulator
MDDAFAAALRKGSGEVLILSMIEGRARHGYEIAKLIEARSGGALRFRVASFYPLLYQLEKRRLIKGRWVEKVGQRRRRYYRITPEGRRVLASQRSRWEQFIAALTALARLRQA